MKITTTVVAHTSTALHCCVSLIAGDFLNERIHSIRKGNDRQTPASGKYSRCSKIRSGMGTKLEVGASVMKNQKIENANTGLVRLHLQPVRRRAMKAYQA